jgi:hypothetical protein
MAAMVSRYQPTTDKIMRLHAQTAMIENGFVHIPETAPWIAEYLHEMTVFPKGKHDDQVDSTAQFLDWFKRPFPGQAFFELMRVQAERYQNPENTERYRVRLRPPCGIGSVQTFSGLHREKFVVVGWTNPEGSRPWLGALLLAYYDPDGRLVYANRAGTGIKQAELERLCRRLQPDFR